MISLPPHTKFLHTPLDVVKIKLSSDNGFFIKIKRVNNREPSSFHWHDTSQYNVGTYDGTIRSRAIGAVSQIIKVSITSPELDRLVNYNL